MNEQSSFALQIPQQTLLDFHLGLNAIPLRAGEKIPALAWEKYLLEKSTWPEREKWFCNQMHYNIGILGSQRLAVQDFETWERFVQFYEKWQALIQETRCVLTAHNGVHVYWDTLQVVRRTLSVCPDLDLCGVGGYVVGAGSVIDHAKCKPSPKCPKNGTSVYKVLGTQKIALVKDLIQSTKTRAEKLGLQFSGRDDENEASTVFAVPREASKTLSEKELDEMVPILTAHWLPDYRHELVITTLGYLARNGVSESAVVELFTRVINEAGDPRYFDEREIRRQYQCTLTAPKLRGFPSLVNVFRKIESAKVKQK